MTTKKTKAAPARKRPAAPLSIIDAMTDPNVWGPWFKNRASWSAWFSFLRALFALPLDESELTTFKQCTGRAAPRAHGHTEATLVIGRRGGKSLIMALIAAYLACFRDWSQHLVPGERGVVTIIAADKRQAQSIFRYLRALLSIPLLGNLIERETAEVLELTNRVSIEVMTASFRTIRGRTVVAALCDELAFWRTDEESANPDADIIAALKPSMATIPGAVMIKASSPYARRGVLWEDHRKHFGKDDSDVLVWQAPTRTMNPSVPQSFIDDETEKDPSNAAAEFGAQFRTDLEAFVPREVVEAVTMVDRFELPPYDGGKFVAWLDPSGGSQDSAACAIAHLENGVAVLDAVREVRAPHSPREAMAEFAVLLKTYGVKYVTGDRYAGMWPRESLAEHGIGYRVADMSASEVFQEFLPMLNSARCELLDLKRVRNQLVSLERKVSRSGRDSISHPPGQHDDVACAVAGALVRAAGRTGIAFTVAKAIPKPPQADPKPPTVNDLLSDAWKLQQQRLETPWQQHLDNPWQP